MAETKKPEDSLPKELRNLGENVVGALRGAWKSPERKRLQHEIGEGLSDLATTMRQEVQQFQGSPTGQRIRADVEDVRQRIRSGEAKAQVRSELLTALRVVNTELGKVASRWRTAGASTDREAGKPGESKDAKTAPPSKGG